MGWRVRRPLPDDTRRTRTTDERGHETYRYFVEPVIVVAAAAVDPTGESVLDIAVGIRANYLRTSRFRREASPQPESPDGVERALLRFRWSSRTGEEQASRVLVVRRDGRAVAVNATVPASRIEELESRMMEILDTVRFDPT